MPGHKIILAPELITEAKRLYESTTTSVRDIAAMLGVSRGTFNNRAHEWGWSRRTHATTTVDLVRMVRGAVAADVTAPPGEGGPPKAVSVSPQQRALLAQRMQAVVEREMSAVEQIVGMIGPAKRDEAEGAIRMLAGISRTLRDIAALNKPDSEMPSDDSDDDEIPCDLDELRAELARRLQAIIEVRITATGGQTRSNMDVSGESR